MPAPQPNCEGVETKSKDKDAGGTWRNGWSNVSDSKATTQSAQTRVTVSAKGIHASPKNVQQLKILEMEGKGVIQPVIQNLRPYIWPGTTQSNQKGKRKRNGGTSQQEKGKGRIKFYPKRLNDRVKTGRPGWSKDASLHKKKVPKKSGQGHWGTEGKAT